MAKKYRVAVIGRTGGGNYGHGLDVVWKQIDNVEVVAVADKHEQGRKAAQTRLGAKKAYADFQEMLDKEKPQIVSVAPRQPDCHRDMVVACAKAGASIFLEKPMAQSLEQADEMVRACEMHHVKCAIAHQTRYSPRVKVIRDMIGEGRLGDLLELRGRGKEDGRGGGQDLMVLGTHIMDLMRLFAGDVKWAFGKVLADGKPATKADIRMGSENIGPIQGDRIQVTFGFDKGVQGTFGTHKAKFGAGKRFGLSIYGSRGVVQLTTGSLPAAYFLDDPSWFPGRSKAKWQEITSAGVGKPEPLENGGLVQGNVWIVKDLIESIEKDRQPLGSMYDGRAALEMILSAYASHKAGGPVALPLKERSHPLAE